jgi:hypothetical protein
MDEGAAVERALTGAAADLVAAGQLFALVGGLAVSVRAEVRFTRDVDFAVAVGDDVEAESLVYRLRGCGYRALASVEHETRRRLSTVRMLSPEGVKIDLLFASSGIEPEIVTRALPVALVGVDPIPVARAEELLAMKVLSMTGQRLQDRLDARHLLAHNPELDLDDVRRSLRMITERGFDRDQDLEAKLDALLAE